MPRGLELQQERCKTPQSRKSKKQRALAYCTSVAKMQVRPKGVLNGPHIFVGYNMRSTATLSEPSLAGWMSTLIAFFTIIASCAMTYSLDHASVPNCSTYYGTYYWGQT
jgi:hypothetical protein